MFESLLFLFSGIIIGAGATWLVYRQRKNSVNEEGNIFIKDIRTELSHYKERLNIKENELLKLTGLAAEKDARLEALGDKLNTQKKEIMDIQEKMTAQFKVLANEILDEKSRKFTRDNREKLDEILKPFSENLKDFREKVEQTRIENREGRASLFTKIADLEKLNARISNEANALTKALKGESKTQGNWGEMILESILEKSGLVKDREFFVQESFTTDGGKRLQPDIIVKYPGDRSIIIDSKVSLVAYEHYVNAEDEASLKNALKAHLQSVRSHIKALESKDYQSEYNVNTLDFVMMFMPVEPAYFLALQSDSRLWSDSYEKRILLISPTNLIAALKMIESIWKQEYQSRNVLEIARQGGALYDDFVLLLERMEKLGKKIKDTQDQYDDTVLKLTGRGNLISRVGKLKDLGIKAKKDFPEKYRDGELPESSN